MKKALLVGALAALAMTFVGCFDGVGGEAPAEETVTPKPFTIAYAAEKQYSAAQFEVADDWESIEVKFDASTDFSKIQFCLVSDKVEKEESWGTAYFSKYPKAEATTTINFADWFVKNDEKDGAEVADSNLKKKGATKITTCSIQNMTKEGFDVKVTSAIVTKKDGTKEAVVAAKDWASIVTEN